MCGVTGFVNISHGNVDFLKNMIGAIRHRGPDAEGFHHDLDHGIGIGHCRLKVIDLSEKGAQPMSSRDGCVILAFNGEIYNYLELKIELHHYPFIGNSDTEVLLAAYEHWGLDCLNKLIGMFVFVLWDSRKETLYLVRDRFGVKPLYYGKVDNGIVFASEIKALFSAGLQRIPDLGVWANYFRYGMDGHSDRTFWKGVRALPPGSVMSISKSGVYRITPWYDLSNLVANSQTDLRQDREVEDELRLLLENTTKLRFRSDVPLGVCLSGGLDSSSLLKLVDTVDSTHDLIHTFTFSTGDSRYDELPWVKKVVDPRKHVINICCLEQSEIPELAERVAINQDEPFGGFPTLGMAKIHAQARKLGIVVLLDGNGLDEGWGGYEYYARANELDPAIGPIQGSSTDQDQRTLVRLDFPFDPDLRLPDLPEGDPVKRLQYRDIRYAKIPRAMRFADRVSMMYSRELREPFLDHRLVELGLRQPVSRKISNGTGKLLPRRVMKNLLPVQIYHAPKRPVQTPQREWLRSELADWASTKVHSAISGFGREFLDREAVVSYWDNYRANEYSNSFKIWQLICLGMISESL